MFTPITDEEVQRVLASIQPHQRKPADWYRLSMLHNYRGPRYFYEGYASYVVLTRESL